MAKHFLNEEQRKQIAAEIEEAEKSTSGEIVPMIVRQSDPYAGARWRSAVFFSLLMIVGYAVFQPHFHPLWYLALQLPALAVGYFVGGLAPIHRYFITRQEMNSEVHQRAIEAFFSQRVNTTRDGTGILIFVSLLERRAEIIADHGINSKIPAGTWDQVMSRLIQTIRTQGMTEALCGAVRECRALLAEHFPRQTDDQNELKNSVVIEK